MGASQRHVAGKEGSKQKLGKKKKSYLAEKKKFDKMRSSLDEVLKATRLEYLKLQGEEKALEERSGYKDFIERQVVNFWNRVEMMEERCKMLLFEFHYIGNMDYFFSQ